MKETRDNTTLPGGKKGLTEQPGKEGNIDLPEYPTYPVSEDIYSKCREEQNINPEDISKMKESNEDEREGTSNEKDFDDDVSGSDLDIPGSELDDDQENVGSEDEENNHYSLGGDNHDDLEDDKGE